MLDSIAIAGAWGYIGRKVLDAALARGLRPCVFDPGPAPTDFDLQRVTRVDSEAEFYNLKAELFHLALHPEARRRGLAFLLRRAASELLFILNEKPMVSPETPGEAQPLIAEVDRSRAVMLYDFPELFDPLTQRITSYLKGFSRVDLSSIVV